MHTVPRIHEKLEKIRCVYSVFTFMYPKGKLSLFKHTLSSVILPSISDVNDQFSHDNLGVITVPNKIRDLYQFVSQFISLPRARTYPIPANTKVKHFRRNEIQVSLKCSSNRTPARATFKVIHNLWSTATNMQTLQQ